jgi:hypothetical protein
MRQIILICSIFFTLALNFKLNAQPIWEENFQIPDKGYWADTLGNLQSDITGVDWSVDVNDCMFVNEGDYAKTVTTSGGRFEVLDSDGDVVWSSPSMDISNYSTVSASLKVSETGSSSGATKKYLKASYWLDSQLFPFSPDSIVSGNWGVKDLKAEGIRGSQFQLVVTMNSSYSNDKVILDDILVEGIDSTLFEPQHIALTKLPSYSFTYEETVISASVLNRKGDIIIDKKYGLTFRSTQLSVTDSSYENGIYTWKVITDSTGKASFTIGFENSSVERIDGIIQFYSQDNLIFSENFEEEGLADWKNDGSWIVSSEMPISGDSSLKHLEQEETGISTISTDNIDWLLGNGNYQFSFKLKNGNWDPSSSNSFYFSLGYYDSIDSLVDGYAIGVNAIGSSDMVSLWVLRNGQPTAVILKTAFDWNENTLAQLDITRDAVGNWTLTATDLTTGNTQSGTGYNNEFEIINQLGLHFKYSQSRSGQLWFDDLLVFRENVPPVIKWVHTLSDGKILVCFSEELKVDLLSKDNFKIENKNGKDYQIQSFEFEGGDTITLETTDIDEVDLLLTAFNIEDLEGTVADSIKFAFNYQMPVSQHDVVITEIMADPSPVVGLPEAEYIEIFNQSEKVIDIENWSLTVNDKISTLPPGKINPGEYFIVCNSGDSSLFSSFGNVLAINDFPSLLNAGTTIKLSTQEGMIIDSVAYSDDWYKDPVKKNGGWSLEKIDPGRTCGVHNNWEASEDNSGGTPGRVNSVNSPNEDILPPEIIETNLLSSTSIEIIFDEEIVLASAENITNYTVDGGLLIDSLFFETDKNKVTLYFESEIEGNTPYHLTLSEIADECDNVSQNISVSFSRQVIDIGDLIINEVLFNPFTDGADFVELYNQSGISIDISKLRLATRSDSLTLKSVYPLSKNKIEFSDQSYMAFTKDSANIVANYWVPNRDKIAEMMSFPSYPDDEGHVVLLNDSLEVIDEFAYSETMHSPLISDLNGVSLERLSFSGETNDPANWHSASSLVGFATPGYENSQPEVIENPDEVSVLLSPDAISPNGDGLNDEMEIEFHLDKTGYLANVFIFDINGRRMCLLLNNGLIGNSTKIVFDGIFENGERLPLGFYILYTELVHSDGEKKVFKQSFLVTDKR